MSICEEHERCLKSSNLGREANSAIPSLVLTDPVAKVAGDEIWKMRRNVEGA